MNQFYTYLHCRPDGMPFYVGKGCGCRAFRVASQKRNLHHQNVVSKYGQENIGIFIFPCESESQALSDEIQQIAQLRREGYELTNITNGGESIFSGCKHSPETKHKLSIANSGNKNGFFGKKHTQETLAKMSKIQSGRTPEHCIRISIAKRGKQQTPEHIAKCAALRIGSKRSIETREKISASLKGKPKSMSGRVKMSAAKKGKSWSAARRDAQNKKFGGK